MKVQISGREKTLYSIYRKMRREAPELRPGDRHLRLSRRRADACSSATSALGILHQLYKPVPGKFKDYIAIPKVNGYQSLHTTLVSPLGRERRVPDAHRADARGGRNGHRRALALQGRRAQRGDAASGWARSGCSRCSTSRTRRATPPSSGTTSRSTCSPTRSTCSRRRARSWRCRAARRRSTSPTRSTPTSATTPSAASVNGEPVPLRTELKNGDVVEVDHRAGVDAQPGLAELRAHRPRALQDPPLPEDHGAGRVRRTWARSCWRRRCAPRAWATCRTTTPSTRRSGSSCCASPATAPAPTC